MVAAAAVNRLPRLASRSSSGDVDVHDRVAGNVEPLPQQGAELAPEDVVFANVPNARSSPLSWIVTLPVTFSTDRFGILRSWKQ
jgi:hypothetical protein